MRTGKFNLYYVLADYSYAYDIELNELMDLKQKAIDYIGKSISIQNNYEIIRIYNEKSKDLKDEINSNATIKELKKYIRLRNKSSDIDKYKLSLSVSDLWRENPSKFDNKDFKADEYNLTVKLEYDYGKSGKYTCPYSFDIHINSNENDKQVDDICNVVFNNVKNYLSNLNVFNDIEPTKDAIKSLDDYFSNLKISTNEYVLSEESFSLTVYYDELNMRNEYLIRANEIIDELSGIKEAYSTIEDFKRKIKDIVVSTLKKELFKTCIECAKGFDIDKGEYSYYVSKSLKLPKRCKPCRKKRKRNKGE
ncbi:hypothetical protein D1872_227710 [compost metagenome]